MTHLSHLARAVNPASSDNDEQRIFCKVGPFATSKGLPHHFLTKFTVDLNTLCWMWHAASSCTPGYPNHRYGRFTEKKDGRRLGHIAHRFAYIWAFGPIPQGLEIDHLCQNKLCVNPAHMELVTHQVNCQRRKRSGSKPGFKFAWVNGKRKKVHSEAANG